jgi:hypothetical protein
MFARRPKIAFYRLFGARWRLLMASSLKAKWIVPPAGSEALRNGIALVSLAAALGLTRIFLYFDLPQPFTAFALCAIAITSWYGGTAGRKFSRHFTHQIRLR